MEESLLAKRYRGASIPMYPTIMKRKREMVDDEGLTSSDRGHKKADKSSLVKLTHDAYTVGWVCALPKEQTAATAMLDQKHANLDKPPNDHNTHTLGAIGNHNVVITCLPKGKIGTNSAAALRLAWFTLFRLLRLASWLVLVVEFHLKLGLAML